MILDTMGAWTRAPIPILRGHVFVWLHFFWWFSFFTHLLMVPVTMIGDGAVLEIPPPAQLTNGGIEMHQLQSDHRRTAIKSCGPHCQ